MSFLYYFTLQSLLRYIVSLKQKKKRKKETDPLQNKSSSYSSHRWIRKNLPTGLSPSSLPPKNSKLNNLSCTRRDGGIRDSVRYRFGQRSQNFEGRPSRFPRTNRASSIREHTRGMFRGTQTYRVSALWMQRSGPPPPPPLFQPPPPACTPCEMVGWMELRCRSHLFIIKFRVYRRPMPD